MNDKRKSKLIILFIVLGLAICGCSSNGGVKTEKQIIGDINNSEYLSKYGLEVYDIEISRRKTDKNNKTDSMVTWIQSKNDIMEYSMGFELNYTLYEEGWLLDSINPLDKEAWQYCATKTPSIEEVDEVIKERHPNAKSYEYNDSEYDEINKITYNYSIIEEHPYVTYDISYNIRYVFTPDENWYALLESSTDGVSDSGSTKTENWNINGTWTYSNSDNLNATITINNYDGKNIDCSYDIKYDGVEKYHFQKSGTFEVQELWLEYTLQKYNSGDSYFTDIYGSGFVVDSSTNVDGSRTIYGYMGDRPMKFSFDKEKGVIFSTPRGGEIYTMTKN